MLRVSYTGVGWWYSVPSNIEGLDKQVYKIQFKRSLVL